MKSSVKQLHGQFRPNHYLLKLEPNKDKKIFSGTVTISGHKIGPLSQRFVLHQSDLKVTSATDTYHEKTVDRTIPIDRINHHQKYQEVRLHSSEKLRNGNYTIELNFKGKI